MKKIALFAIAYSTLASAALGQVTVRTGEHDSFTRMAINIPIGTEWNVEETQKGYDILLIGAKFDNLNGFFDIISRDRIEDASVEGQGERLSLDVGCKCHYIVDLWRPNWLLVDIHDGAQAASAINIDQQIQAQVPDEVRSAPIAILDQIALPLILNRETKIEIPRSHMEFKSDNPISEVTRQFERTISESLSRASSQGIIQLVNPEGDRAFRDQGIGSSVPSARTGTPGLSAATALDEINSTKATDETPKNDVECVDNAETNISSWATGENFSTEIYEGRRKIFGEFDFPNSKAIHNLARTYVYYGFGREAKQVLEIDDRNSLVGSTLRTIAEVLDGDQVSYNRVGEQAGCENDMSFWAFLAMPGEIDSNNLSIESIILTFKSLPNGLQILLGPRLVDGLRKVGASEAASSVLAPAEAIDSNQIEISIATANIDIDRGNQDEAIYTLNGLAEDNQRMTPAALLQLLDLTMENDIPIENSIIGLLDTMSFEYRHLEIGGELQKAYIESLIHNGSYQDSLLEFGRVEGNFTIQERKDFLDRIYKGVASNANTDVFLDFAFSDGVFEIGEEGLRNYPARLMQLGFVERANVLSGSAVQSVDVQTFVEDGSQVGAILPNEGGTVMSNAPLDSAWRSGNFEQLRVSDDELLAAAADRKLSEPLDIELDLNALGQANELIKASQDLRATVDDLIERFGSPGQ